MLATVGSIFLFHRLWAAPSDALSWGAVCFLNGFFVSECYHWRFTTQGRWHARLVLIYNVVAASAGAGFAVTLAWYGRPVSLGWLLVALATFAMVASLVTLPFSIHCAFKTQRTLTDVLE